MVAKAHHMCNVLKSFSETAFVYILFHNSFFSAPNSLEGLDPLEETVSSYSVCMCVLFWIEISNQSERKPVEKIPTGKVMLHTIYARKIAEYYADGQKNELN